ncbi:MAG TPA: TfuA-like protein [Candidatus Dormibacteraeota bacterium]|jgi:hypothetical protein|nr:TfuA-like protein [Candidatus Dormibacteraeota bacterium]
MPARVHVFTGPTLSSGEVRDALPDAVIHPPAAAGDLVRLACAPGDAVVIVDGPMTEGRAVRHQEILALVDRGVEVWATGALGALRGAELHQSGVRAHGRVARLFVRGSLDGDDEVAVLHDGAEGRWTARSLALVDIRATCRAAQRAGVIDPWTCRQAVEAAQRLPVAQRTWPAVVAAAVEAGIDPEMAWRIKEHARTQTATLMRDDAVACLRAVRRARAAAPRPRPRAATRPRLTAHGAGWSDDVSGDVQPGAGLVSDVTVLTFCRLLAVDYPTFQRRTALRTLAALAGPQPPSGDREGRAMLREFAARHGLDVDSLRLWLVDRGLCRDDLLDHLRRESAVALLLEADGVLQLHEAGIESALESLVAEHARRRGFVAAGAARTWERAWLSAVELDTLTPTQRLARLAARSFRRTPGLDWRAPLLQDLKVSGVFRVVREGAGEAQESWRRLNASSPEQAAEHTDPERLVSHFAARWQAQQRFDLALLDRGFTGQREFVQRAPMFVAVDATVATYRDLHCLGRPALASS